MLGICFVLDYLTQPCSWAGDVGHVVITYVAPLSFLFIMSFFILHAEPHLPTWIFDAVSLRDFLFSSYTPSYFDSSTWTVLLLLFSSFLWGYYRPSIDFQ